MRDPFIQAFAWLTLAVCGLGVATGALTTVLLFSFAGNEVSTVHGQHSGATVVLFRHLPLFALGFVAYSIAGFVASVGLLRGEQAWARKLWTVLLGVGIGWALLIMGLEIFYPDPPGPAPAAGSLFPSVATLALFTVVPFSLAMIALSLWLIRRLNKGSSMHRAPHLGTGSQGQAS